MYKNVLLIFNCRFDTFSDLYDDNEEAKQFIATGAGSLFKDETVELQKRVMARKKLNKKSPMQSDVAQVEDVLNVHGGIESHLHLVQDSDDS